MKTIGIDIGTTTISAVVMDTEKKQLLAIRTVPNNSFLRTKQEWERIQDGELLVKKARILLDELLEQYPFVEAIGLTGQMHGILYTDEEGQAVSPLYTWQDKSGDQAEFNGESVTAWLKRTYGIPASTGYGLVTHLYHVKKGLVPPGSTSMCTIADYLGMCLTGRKTPLLHASNGASLGFYDTKIWRFQTEIIKDAGMNPALLPKVTAEVEELGLFEAPGIEARPYLQKKYILTGAILCAGRAYAILEHFFEACARAMGLKAEEQYELMERLVKSAGADAGGIRVDTRFQGTRTNPELLGSISGISEENLRPENLVRGFIQGIAGEYYEIYKKISRGLGIKAEKLLASGNGVRKNAALREALESLFQAELTLTDLQEEAACGAALSARYSLRFK